MKRKILALIVIVALVAVGVFFDNKSKANAQAPLLTPFGGPILAIAWCECPVPGYMITVGPPSGGVFVYYSGSLLFPNFNIFTTDTWVLGLGTGVPIGCGHYEAYCTDQVPTDGLIYMVGTS